MQLVSALLKEKKLKLTPQRLAILSILHKTDKHPTAESIYNSLLVTNPSISLATVYKTLDSFKKANLVQELNFGEDSFRYDARCDEHMHIVCNSCNEIFDLAITPFVTSLSAEMELSTGFKIDHKQFYFYGVCKNCRE